MGYEHYNEFIFNKKNRLPIEEGKDYRVPYKRGKETLYYVKTYEASRYLASNDMLPLIFSELPSWASSGKYGLTPFGEADKKGLYEGAKWVISLPKIRTLWDKYTQENNHFFFWIRNDRNIPEEDRKICIVYHYDNFVTCYDAYGNEITVEFPRVIEEAIEDIVQFFTKERLLTHFQLHNGRYDYHGDLTQDILYNFVEDGKFVYPFGVIKGNFKCRKLDLVSLENAPIEVTKNFDCSDNHLTSLKGAPRKVGRTFDCSENNLTSLEGGPQSVGSYYFCGHNKLTTLNGAPSSIPNGSFNCVTNKLTSLEGAPSYVGINFDCLDNPLKTLEGKPTTIIGDFIYDETTLR